jgi:heme/copper-type cytochrome/quinol oxidase subunit 2
VIFASLSDYLPLADLLKIVVACLAVAVIAPTAAALVITGFEKQSQAHRAGETRLIGDARIAIGVTIIAALIVLGVLAVAFP